MNRLIEVEGSPFERGRLVGENFRDLIRENVEHYSSFWGSDQIRVFTRSIPLIKEYDSSMVVLILLDFEICECSLHPNILIIFLILFLIFIL